MLYPKPYWDSNIHVYKKYKKRSKKQNCIGVGNIVDI